MEMSASSVICNGGPALKTEIVTPTSSSEDFRCWPLVSVFMVVEVVVYGTAVYLSTAFCATDRGSE